MSGPVFRAEGLTVNLFAGDARTIIYVPSVNALQVMSGRSFLLSFRRTLAIEPLFAPIVGILHPDGLSFYFPIPGDLSLSLYEAGREYALSYDIIETTTGGSDTRLIGRVNVAPSSNVPSGLPPIALLWPTTQAIADVDVIGTVERGAPGPGLADELKLWNDISVATPEAARAKIRQWGAEGAEPFVADVAGYAEAADQSSQTAADSAAASVAAKDLSEAAAQTAIFGGDIHPDRAAGIAANPSPSEGNEFVAYGPAGSYATRYKYTAGEWGVADDYPNRTALSAGIALFDASIKQNGGVREPFKPVQYWTNGLGFIIGRRFVELHDPVPVSDVATRTVSTLGFVLAERRTDGSERRPGGYSRPVTGVRQRTINPLGFISSEELNDGSRRELGTLSRAITDARWRRVNPLGFVTFEEGLDGSIKGVAASVTPTPEPETLKLPIATDGRSITRWRGKAAKLLSPGGDGLITLAFFGNSWADKRPIVQATANRLRSRFGNAGGGWISCDSYLTAPGDDLGPLDDATWTQTGWTLFDITSTLTLPTGGCSLDGKSLYTFGATATARATFTGTAFSIFRPKTNGTVRYRVDGGAWVALTGDGSNTLEVTTVTGLLNGSGQLLPAQHIVDVDVVGNTGMAVWQGLKYWSEGAKGVQIFKFGNSGLDASQLSVYVSQYIAPALAHFDIDAINYDAGTNEYRRSNNNPTAFRSTIETFVSVARSVIPDVGFVFYAPARSNGTVARPLSEYRDALGALAIDGGHEFYSMYDDWDAWSVENARGMWRDPLHVNDAGAWRLACALDQFFYSNRCI